MMMRIFNKYNSKLKEVHGFPTDFPPNSVLESSRAALQLQQYADQKG